MHSLALWLLTQCSPPPAPGDATTDTIDTSLGTDSSAEGSTDSSFDALESTMDSGSTWTPPAACANAGVWSDAGPGITLDGGTFVSGNAFRFNTGGLRVEGAYVTMLEQPDWCVRTDVDGFFRFDNVLSNTPVTLQMYHPSYVLTQTGTNVAPPTGIEQLTFQAPPPSVESELALVLGVRLDHMKCQIAATVTQIGRSLYTQQYPTHGVPGATVTISPMPASVDGPIYFQHIDNDAGGSIIPDRTLTATSVDGGVLFLNVTPGDYTLSAQEVGFNFQDVHVRCVAGVLVNPSPPWSIQQY